MGGSSSKAARSAAGSAARKYPSRPSTYAPPSSQQANAQQQQPAAGPGVQASATRSEAIDLDARDPQFASRLSKLGPVKPAPTFSPSSTTKTPPSSSSASQNGGPVYPAAAASPAMAIIAARQRIQDAVEQERSEAGRKGFPGRQFLDITTVKKALVLRDERGLKASEIEEALGLKKGVVASLGKVGVVEVA